MTDFSAFWTLIESYFAITQYFLQITYWYLIIATLQARYYDYKHFLSTTLLWSRSLPLYKGRKGLMAASKCPISDSWASQGRGGWGGIQVSLIEETGLVPSPALYPHLSCSNLANNELGPKPFLPVWPTTHLRLLSLHLLSPTPNWESHSPFLVLEWHLTMANHNQLLRDLEAVSEHWE